MSGIEIQSYIGAEVTPYIDDLARLRIEVFREFPYLYDGSLSYEQKYLARYTQCPRCVFVLARQGESVVGVSTGLPLADECDEIRKPLEDAGMATKDIFYFGESVLLPACRGQGIGHRFFDERERFAQRLGPYPITTFCAVERPTDHPMCPSDYRPHDVFWAKRGYTKHPTLRTSFAWLDLGETKETAKPMTYWLKHWP